MDDTSGKNNSRDLVEQDELAQVAAVKDKQIDLLSNMLAQKEVDLRNQKIENEKIQKESSAARQQEVQRYMLENQKLLMKMADLQKIVESNGSMKELQNYSMVLEQNKIFKG